MKDEQKSRDLLIKELAEMRQRAHEAEELIRAISSAAAAAIVLYDMQGQAKYVSPSFTSIFGWTIDEVRGKRIDFVPESEREETAAAVQLIVGKGGTLSYFETKRYTKDRRILDVSIGASRVRDHKGDPAGMLVILTDRSDYEQMRARLAQTAGNLDAAVASRTEELSKLNEELKQEIKRLQNAEAAQ